MPYFCYISKNKVDLLCENINKEMVISEKRTKVREYNLNSEAEASIGLTKFFNVFNGKINFGNKGVIQTEKNIKDSYTQKLLKVIANIDSAEEASYLVDVLEQNTYLGKLYYKKEYAGKIVCINKAEYIIGDFISQGASKIVHKLINKKIGICSHVIKIHRDPNNEYLLVNELLGYEFYKLMGTPAMQIFLSDNKEKTFHVQQLVTYNREIDSDLLAKGKKEYENGNYQDAYSTFQILLSNENKWNTEALLGSFLCLVKAKEELPSIEMLQKILDIEPNSKYYFELFTLYSMKSGHYDDIYKLITETKIDIEPIFSKILKEYKELQLIKEEITTELDKLLEEHIRHFYVYPEFISLSELMREEEDKRAFVDCLKDYENSSNPASLMQMIEIAKSYPKIKDFSMVCLQLAFSSSLYYAVINLYENTSSELDLRFHEMAAASYINIGEPEKAYMLSNKYTFNKKLTNDIIDILNKKEEYDILSKQATDLIMSGKTNEAFELQKKACDIFPFGFPSCFNKLLYYIYKNDSGDFVVPRLQGGIDLVCYFLHLMIYYLIIGNNEEIRKIDLLVAPIYNGLLELKENDVPIPSRVLFFCNDGTIECPYKETAESLKEYGAMRNITNQLYYKIIAFYETEAISEKIP